MTTAMLCTADLNESILTRLDPDLTPPILAVEVTTHNPDGTVELWVGQHQMVLAATHEAIDAVVKHVQPEKLIQQEDPTMTTFDPRTVDVVRESAFLALDQEFIEPGHQSRYGEDTWQVHFVAPSGEGIWMLLVKHEAGLFTGTPTFHRLDDPDPNHFVLLPASEPVDAERVVAMVNEGLALMMIGVIPEPPRDIYYDQGLPEDPRDF